MFLNYLKKIDWVFLIPVFLLCFFGLAALYAGTLNVENPDLTLLNKQFLFFGIGVLLLFGISSFDYRFLKNYSIGLYIFSVLLLAAVLWWGVTIRGTRGWFQVFGFSFQPVEIAKLSLVVILAYFYSIWQKKMKIVNIFWISLLISLPVIVLSIVQPDFGSAFVLIGIWFLMFLLPNLSWKNLFFLLVILAAVGFMVWNYVLVDYQQDRILTFLDPDRDPLGRGYNVRQSVIAVGSGGMIGRGLGLGSQSQLRFLPETETDFIFATISEGLGFFGSGLIVVFFSILFFGILAVMKKAKDDFSLYLCYGIGSIFFIQAFINIGMNVGLLPVTGLPLPFVSYGGSFLLISLISIGIIESVAIRQRDLTF